MAEFGVSATAVSPVANSVTPESGVSRSSALAEGLSSVLDVAGNIFEGRQQSKNDAFIGDFITQQMSVTDALDQGTGGIRTAAQARTILRKNFLQAINANPSLRDDLIKAQSDALSLFGGSSLIADGTLEEQRYNDRTDQLVSSGLLPAVHTDSQREQADTSARLTVAARERYEETMRTINMQSSMANLTSAQEGALEAQREQATLRFIQDSSPNEMQALKNQFGGILSSNLSETEKQAAIEDLYLEWRAETASLIGEIDNSQYTAFLKPFEDLREIYVQRATGELNDAEVERRITRITQRNEALLLADPTIARLAGISEVLGQVPFEQTLMQSAGMGKLLEFVAGGDPAAGTELGVPTQAASPFLTENSGKQALRGYLDSVFTGLDSSNEGVRDESMRRVGSFLESIEDYEGMVRRNPESAIALVNWMAGPAFANARQSNPELFENISAVQEVLKNHYENEVWTMVATEFRNNDVFVMGEGPNARLAQRDGGFEPVPNEVGARATPSGMEFFALNEDAGASVRNRVRELNSTLAPVINNTLKAASHLEGNTNYQQMWERTADQILGGGMTNDAGDDLSLDSFSQGESALDQALTTGGYVGDGDYLDAETPAEVAASFVGFEENTHKQVLSAFIRNNVGTNLDPSKTAWCAAFVNAALGATGGDGTDSNLARSFLNWGEPVATPIRGDVVVFKRGTSNWQGHVGFYVGEDSNGNIRVLGGNQGNKVSIQTYSRADLLGIRRDGNSNTNSSYNSEEEAQAAFERGELQAGDVVNVNGKRVRVDEES